MEFDAFGVDLQFTDDAIEHVAEKAEKNKTGARALIGVWENILTNFQYDLPGSGHKHLLINSDVCKAPRDHLLIILSRSPFEDFAEQFLGECGIVLDFSEAAEVDVLKYAEDGQTQVSEALKILLTVASALNYMGYTGVFKISKEILEDPRYFDGLYMDWHKKQIENQHENPVSGHDPDRFS